jgi:beta-lactam-binding protein with PASTA domain
MTRGGEGKVLRQLPHEGESAHPGDAVDLIITIAPAQVEVPSVFGMSRDNAEQSLQSAGLNIGRVAFVTDGTKTLGIISQKPPAKTFVDSATLVDVVENRPPPEDSTKVPDLIGKSLAQSDSAVKQAGLVLGEVVRVGPDRPDEVTDQKPKAGTSVSAFSRVDIALGVKVPIVRLIVPDVVNLDVHSAQRVLRDSGFTQISIDSPGGDTITSQSIIESQLPAAGTQVPAPTPVALTVRKPPPPRLVPNLVGHRKNDARNIAQLDTFQMVVTSEVRRLRWRDEVVSQHPLAWSSRSTDNTIEVVAEVPVIPPLLVIGVIGFGAVAGTVWRIINPPPPPPPEPVTPQKTPEAPKPDVKLVSLTEPAGPPTLDTGGRSTLIHAEYRLLFDVTTDPVRTAIPNDSIVKSTELRNV